MEQTKDNLFYKDTESAGCFQKEFNSLKNAKQSSTGWHWLTCRSGYEADSIDNKRLKCEPIENTPPSGYPRLK